MSGRFRLLKQGYDRFEVDHTIEKYEAQLKESSERLLAYENQLKQANEKIASMENRYKQLQSQLVAKEKAASSVHQMAIKQSNEIIERAHRNADLIIEEALSSVRVILTDLSKITNQTSIMKRELKTQVHLLSQMIDEVELPNIPDVKWFEHQTSQSEE